MLHGRGKSFLDFSLTHDGSKVENEADKFASEILKPRQVQSRSTD